MFVMFCDGPQNFRRQRPPCLNSAHIIRELDGAGDSLLIPAVSPCMYAPFIEYPNLQSAVQHFALDGFKNVSYSDAWPSPIQSCRSICKNVSDTGVANLPPLYGVGKFPCFPNPGGQFLTIDSSFIKMKVPRYNFSRRVPR